jgi:hypothetical protein
MAYREWISTISILLVRFPRCQKTYQLPNAAPLGGLGPREAVARGGYRNELMASGAEFA